jgi:DNA-binding MarR family transcriptional regulator
MYYTELFRAIKILYKKVSIDAFNSHIKSMIGKALISKNDNGERGKKVYYFLTGKAKQLQRLKILESNHAENTAAPEIKEREERRIKIYIFLFYAMEIMRKFPKMLTKEEVSALLANLQSSDNDLVEVDKGESGDRNGRYEKWRQYKPISNVTIAEEEEYYQGKKQKTVYSCWLPGICITDIRWSVNGSESINYSLKELEEAFYLLIEEGILKPVMKFRNEWRYAVADESLNDLLLAYWYIYGRLAEIIHSRWCHVRPTVEELKWMELFDSKKSIDSYLFYAYQDIRRLQNNNDRKRYAIKIREEVKQSREDINELLTEIEADYLEKKHKFPIEQISEMVYPPQFSRAMWDYWMR